MSDEGTDYYTSVLEGIGAPASPNNLRFFVAWQKAEGGSAANNAFNTTQPEPGDSKYNSVGVRNYPDEQTGIAATIKTLLNGHYPTIVSDLQADDDPTVTASNDDEISTWGTSPTVIRQALGVADVTSIPSTSPTDTGTVKTVGGTTVGAASSSSSGTAKPVINDDGSVSSDLMKFVIYGVAAVAGAALVVGGAWRGLQPAREKAADAAQKVQATAAKAGEVAARFA